MVAALKSLEADGLVERRAYSERPLRHEVPPH
jgi:DNA-binding HxlR family transcriptional regulator